MAAFNDVHTEWAAESQAHCKCPAGAQSQGLLRRGSCEQVRWAGDRCTVCDSDVDYDQDQLVSCDMCGITVHQSCYGVQELPGEDDMWLCRACELKVTFTRRFIPLYQLMLLGCISDDSRPAHGTWLA